MNKSFILVILASSLILTQTCLAKSKKDAKPTSAENQPSADLFEDDEPWDEEDWFNPDEKKISMSCLLFGIAACSEECRMKSQLYDIKATGICNQEQTCICQYKNHSFDHEWEKKFDADYVHRAILENKPVHEQVQKLFENPLRTGEQFKSLLEPIVTPFQYTKLKIRDHTLAAEFTKEDGEPDTEAVQKYVSEQVDKWLKSPSALKFLKSVKYKAKLLTALKQATKNTRFNIAYRLDQMKNQILNDTFEEYLKQKNIEKPDVQLEKQDLNEVFNATFVNEIIKRIGNKNKNSSESSAAKKSPARSKSTKKSS